MDSLLPRISTTLFALAQCGRSCFNGASNIAGGLACFSPEGQKVISQDAWVGSRLPTSQSFKGASNVAQAGGLACLSPEVQKVISQDAWVGSRLPHCLISYSFLQSMGKVVNFYKENTNNIVDIHLTGI